MFWKQNQVRAPPKRDATQQGESHLGSKILNILGPHIKMPNKETAELVAGKETFWKRSRRTLGDKYFAFLKESTEVSPVTPITPGQELDPQSQAYIRRREQIRRSQR